MVRIQDGPPSILFTRGLLVRPFVHTIPASSVTENGGKRSFSKTSPFSNENGLVWTWPHAGPNY